MKKKLLIVLSVGMMIYLIVEIIQSINVIMNLI